MKTAFYLMLAFHLLAVSFKLGLLFFIPRLKNVAQVQAFLFKYKKMDAAANWTLWLTGGAMLLTNVRLLFQMWLLFHAALYGGVLGHQAGGAERDGRSGRQQKNPRPRRTAQTPRRKPLHGSRRLCPFGVDRDIDGDEAVLSQTLLHPVKKRRDGEMDISVFKGCTFFLTCLPVRSGRLRPAHKPMADSL